MNVQQLKRRTDELQMWVLDKKLIVKFLEDNNVQYLKTVELIDVKKAEYRETFDSITEFVNNMNTLFGVDTRTIVFVDNYRAIYHRIDIALKIYRDIKFQFYRGKIYVFNTNLRTKIAENWFFSTKKAVCHRDLNKQLTRYHHTLNEEIDFLWQAQQCLMESERLLTAQYNLLFTYIEKKVIPPLDFIYPDTEQEKFTEKPTLETLKPHVDILSRMVSKRHLAQGTFELNIATAVQRIVQTNVLVRMSSMIQRANDDHAKLRQDIVENFDVDVLKSYFETRQIDVSLVKDRLLNEERRVDEVKSLLSQPNPGKMMRKLDRMIAHIEFTFSGCVANFTKSDKKTFEEGENVVNFADQVLLYEWDIGTFYTSVGAYAAVAKAYTHPNSKEERYIDLIIKKIDEVSARLTALRLTEQRRICKAVT